MLGPCVLEVMRRDDVRVVISIARDSGVGALQFALGEAGYIMGPELATRLTRTARWRWLVRAAAIARRGTLPHLPA